MSSTDPKEELIGLQLGDIIQIEAPSNARLNNNIFIVNYIDPNLLRLTNTDTSDQVSINIVDGKLSDESITTIALLDRNDNNGYARQNYLLPGNWIDIHFGGDVPTIITGEITNLDEDMIEINTYPDNDKIYIDFGYKGLPLNLPIDSINLRKVPADLEPKPKEAELPPIEEVPSPEGELPSPGEEEATVLVTPIDVKEQLKELLVDADQIEIGSEMDEITQIVEVPEAEQRYSIETQANDILDELLSTIPNAQRTTEVLNNLHIMIERFTQMRQLFSVFNKQGNIIKAKKNGANYKPLVEKLFKLNQKLYWILPIVKNQRKLYNVEIDDVDYYQDVIPLTLAESRIEESQIIDQYKNNALSMEYNKYQRLLEEMNPQLTPFAEPRYDEDTITSKHVLENLIVAVNNLDDFYSSVAKNDIVKRRKFVIEYYNLGLTGLRAEDIKGSKMIAQRINLTQNDKMSVKGFLTFPEPIIRFSHINLPGTSILDKANLSQHYLNYWMALTTHSEITTYLVDNLDKPLEFTPETFSTNLKEFILDDSLDDDDDDDGKYRKYLEAIIPKTRVLFELVKKYIVGKLSLTAVIGYLEPFMIYHSDLSYKQYEEITAFIQKCILDYKKTYTQNFREFQRLNDFNWQKNVKVFALNDLVTASDDFQTTIWQSYEILPENFYQFTSSELLMQMINLDYNKLFMNALSLLDLDLHSTVNVQEEFIEAKQEFESYLKEDEAKNKCKKYVLAKKYMALDELQDDNGIDIYFDKRFDTTRYDILQEYYQQQTEMEPTDFKEFLESELKKNIGLSDEEAAYDAESMIIGKRKVVNGQYAMLEVEGADDKPIIHYYKREGHRWEKDDTLGEGLFIDNSKLFCNIQQNCFEINNDCDDTTLASTKLKQKSIKNIVDEFDAEYKLTKTQLKAKIDTAYYYNLDNIHFLKYMLLNNRLKYDRIQMRIGAKHSDIEIITSPFAKLRDLILGQTNFVKKQNDIQQFAQKFTREAIEQENEDIHWRYCVETDGKLLPAFLYELSYIFINGDNYQDALDRLCTEIGVLSDNGDAWVDKHSGYVIKSVEFDTEEGFDELGFKIKSRETLEQELGNSVLQMTQPVRKFDSPQAEMVSNIVSAMAGFLGISMDSQREFIIKNVLGDLESQLPNEERYRERAELLLAKHGKKLPSYKSAYDNLLLLLTLDYLLIALQTLIPSAKTRKTFPGCNRSFEGYPLDGTQNMSALEYVACIANKIKSSSEPWNTIRRISVATIMKKMQGFLDKVILIKPEIQAKLKEKKEFLEITDDDFIPVEHDINTWNTFLPPLKEFRLGPVSSVSEHFKGSLIANIKSGSRDQFIRMDIIESKIIYFSLSIIEKIQKILDKKSALLTNALGEAFLENVCCDNRDYNVYNYFAGENSTIGDNNETVQHLSDIINDIVDMSKAAILLDERNTKLKYPVIENQFSEETIYRGFIVFCKFNRDMPLSTDLQHVCMDNTSQFNINDSIAEKIRILKSEGRNFSIEGFMHLLQIIENQNLVHLDLDKNIIDREQRLRDLLIYFDHMDTDNIPALLTTNLTNLLDNYKLSLTEDTTEMRELKNYLSISNAEMTKELIIYLRAHSGLNKRRFKKIEDFLTSIHKWELTGDNVLMDKANETNYKFINFAKNSIHDLCTVFPTIILNQVDYDDVTVPRHWKLSQKHNVDVKNIIEESYKNLQEFYSDKDIRSVLELVQLKSAEILLLSNDTPAFASVYYKNTERYSVFDKTITSLLYTYYFLYAMNNYLIVKEEPALILQEVASTEESPETLSSVEVDEQSTGIITELDIVEGEKLVMDRKIAMLLVNFITIFSAQKTTINYNYNTIMEKVHRAKEKEKTDITTYLKEMTIEERAIEKEFKNHKLERWSKGLQKGLTQYVKDTYDEEREAIEQRAINELKLGKTSMVTDMNRDIYLLDALAEDNRGKEIDKEVFDISNLPEDDDYGEQDGDEGF